MQKIPFEIRRYEGKNAIFIDNQLFDWNIEEEAIEKIKKIKDKAELKEINANIRMFLLDCLESCLNRKITIRDVLESLRSGHIEFCPNELENKEDQQKSLTIRQNYSSIHNTLEEGK